MISLHDLFPLVHSTNVPALFVLSVLWVILLTLGVFGVHEMVVAPKRQRQSDLEEMIRINRIYWEEHERIMREYERQLVALYATQKDQEWDDDW